MLDALAAALRPDTVLVSMMAAANETGVLQGVAGIAALCRQRGVAYHCDAAQACGHVPLDPSVGVTRWWMRTRRRTTCPWIRGVGTLVLHPGLALAPQLHDGGQERGHRSGSLSPPLIVGLAKVLTLALQDQRSRGQRLQALREKLWHRLNGLKLPSGVESCCATAAQLTACPTPST